MSRFFAALALGLGLLAPAPSQADNKNQKADSKNQKTDDKNQKDDALVLPPLTGMSRKEYRIKLREDRRACEDGRCPADGPASRAEDLPARPEPPPGSLRACLQRLGDWLSYRALPVTCPCRGFIPYVPGGYPPLYTYFLNQYGPGAPRPCPPPVGHPPHGPAGDVPHGRGAGRENPEEILPLPAQVPPGPLPKQ